MKKNAVAYIRKSSEDHEENSKKQVNSFSYQERVIRDIEKKNNLHIIKIFKEDQSGYKAYERKGFNEMLEYLDNNANHSSIIICTEINRLARNFGDGGKILWFLQSGKIREIYTYDKKFSDSSSDQLMVAIHFAMAKHSSDETGFRTTRSYESKAETQGQPPKPAIVGYKSIGITGKREWILDKKYGPKIRQIFEEFSTGRYTLEEIAEYAASIGVTNHKNGNKPYTKNTLLNWLSNIEYTGIFFYNNKKYGGKYPKLISSELFYRVKEVLEGNAHPKDVHLNYAYTGLIRCSDCKQLMSGTSKKGNVYYRCPKRKEPCKNQNKHYLNEKKIDEKMIYTLKNIQISDKIWRTLKQYVDSINKEEIRKIQTKKKQVMADINNLEEENKQLGKARVEGKIEQEMYETLREDVESRSRSLRQRLVGMENQIEKLKDLMMDFIDNIRVVSTRFEHASPENRRAILEVFCENLTWDGKKLRWRWKKPYLFLTKRQESEGWLLG